MTAAVCQSRTTGYTVVLVTYLAAGLAALATSAVARGHHALTIRLWADLAATAVVFAVSMAVGNSSLYDPYWARCRFRELASNSGKS
jgi:hypothetical protein